MQFRQILEEDFEQIKNIQSTTQYNGSDFSELYLKGWMFYDYKKMQIFCDEKLGIFYIRFIPNENVFGIGEGNDYCYLSPLCKKENFVFAVDEIAKYCAENNEDMRICGMTKKFAELLDKEKYGFDDNPDYREYLYLPQTLIELAGKKYHSKRNHISKFLAKYSNNAEEENFIFRPYEPSDRKRIRRLLRGWKETKDFSDDALAEESEEERVVEMALDFVEKKPNFFCDIIEIENVIAAFSIGEITPSNIAVIHIEKADVQFDGVYPTINQMFAQKHFEGVRFINRQEDMGLEGLRKSKMSYYPVAFAEQCVVWKKLKFKSLV